MFARVIMSLAMTCMLIQLAGCKKEDEKNLSLSSYKVTFDYTDESATVSISNTGSSEFSWTLSTPTDLLEFSKKSGSCSRNNPDVFDIRLLRQKIHQDSIKTSVTITASTGETADISLLILGFPEKKIRYNYPVADARYDRVNDRLVVLASSGNTMVLDILDLGTNTFSQIPLPGNGDLLSVSPDGTYAVTSSNNNNRITRTDLLQKKVLNTFTLEQFGTDLIATADEYCYYFPYYNNTDIGKLNLSNGNFTSFNYSPYFDLDMAVLHPSGKYIYTVGYSFSKFNISGPDPAFVYSNTGYSGSSKLWISGAGTRVFTSERQVFNIDPELPQNDITSVQEVPIGQNYIYSMDNNLVYNEFYLIPSNSSYGTDYQSSQVLVLGNDLSQLRTVHLEPFYFENHYSQQGYNTEDAAGQYVFSSSDGGKIIVVSRASDSYSYSWGIEIISRNW